MKASKIDLNITFPYKDLLLFAVFFTIAFSCFCLVFFIFITSLLLTKGATQQGKV